MHTGANNQPKFNTTASRRLAIVRGRLKTRGARDQKRTRTRASSRDELGNAHRKRRTAGFGSGRRNVRTLQIASPKLREETTNNGERRKEPFGGTGSPRNCLATPIVVGSCAPLGRYYVDFVPPCVGVSFSLCPLAPDSQSSKTRPIGTRVEFLTILSLSGANSAPVRTFQTEQVISLQTRSR